ncbi:hypothetical protein GBAR_LOCUS27851, partial [Geodia barretti]
RRVCYPQQRGQPAGLHRFCRTPQEAVRRPGRGGRCCCHPGSAVSACSERPAGPHQIRGYRPLRAPEDGRLQPEPVPVGDPHRDGRTAHKARLKFGPALATGAGGVRVVPAGVPGACLREGRASQVLVEGRIHRGPEVWGDGLQGGLIPPGGAGA